MLTHIDSGNNPTMVDITEKKFSIRTATAQTRVQLPSEVKEFFKGDEIYLKKGPVFQTAIIAGTMAVKKTSDLIPFCHQIPVESCKFNISMDETFLVTINCKVRTTYKTGVEMEALQGATQAALAVYDMCKALSHNIVIKETRLLSKTGGKRTLFSRPTYGLVLTGGKSQRMFQDKALISYKNQPHAEYIFNILKNFCDGVFLSARPNQWTGTPLEKLPVITDKFENAGPAGGILSAFEKFPDANWIVVACDLVHFNAKTVENLLAEVDEEAPATCYKNAEKGFPEPLCAFYTPKARHLFAESIGLNISCPVKILKNAEVKLIEQGSEVNLANINTPEERQTVLREIG